MVKYQLWVNDGFWEDRTHDKQTAQSTYTDRRTDKGRWIRLESAKTQTTYTGRQTKAHPDAHKHTKPYTGTINTVSYIPFEHDDGGS